MRGVFPGSGVLGGRDELSSWNMRPMDDNGLLIVRSIPLKEAGSSSSPDDTGFCWYEDGPSEDVRRAVLGRLGSAFSESSPRDGSSCFGSASGATSCFSAMADTAASTCFSNSSSVIVSVVRSRFSIN